MRLTQACGTARLVIDLDAGARVASLVVREHELLVTAAAEPIDWGCYPMAPWAGRIRNAEFAFHGRQYQLPRAIHGTVFDRVWIPESDDTFVAELGHQWPFDGFVRQVVRLEEHGVFFRLEVHALRASMPAACGWHPWFVRRLGDADARLQFQAAAMLQRDPDGVASQRRVLIPEGPWDDCFVGVQWPARLTWHNVLELTVSSTCDNLVVYTEPPHAMCVEPQTHPPNALNTGAALVTPGQPLTAEMRWSWVA